MKVISEQVAGVLALNDLHFAASETGSEFRLLFETSAVFVRVAHSGRRLVVTVSSPVVSGIDMEGAGGADALNLLNDLNLQNAFVKFLLVAGDLLAVQDLPADEPLRKTDLLDAVYTAAALAEELGLTLGPRLGGKTFAATLAERRDDAAELGIDDES